MPHDKQHSISSTSDHTSTITSGKMLKADANGLPAEATNTDTEVSNAVSKAHDRQHAIDSTIDHQGQGDIVTHNVSEFDAAGAADTAETNAKAYTDSALGEHESTYTHSDIALNTAVRHDRQHSLSSTSDHTSTITSGKILKADTNGLPTAATNTDTEVSNAVTKAHDRQHALDSTSDHTGITGTSGNFLSRNAYGLPQDSGYKATDFAPASKGVTNGDSHDHYGGDGAQIDHGTLAGLSDDDHTQYLLKSGGTMTGDIDMDGNKVKGLATPSDDEDASTKEYSDTHVAGLDVDITGLADGNTLVWNETNTKWVPSEGGGGTHALDSGTHTIGGLTTGKLAKIGDSETPLISSTNTDEEISNAVNKTHDQVHDIDGDDHNPLSGNADDLVELDADGKLRSSGVSVEDLEDEIDDAIATHAAMSQDVHGASSDDTLLNTGNSNGARMWFTRMMMEKL